MPFHLVDTTGMLVHPFWWLTSNGEYNFKNPSFIPTVEKPIAIYCVHGTADRPQAFARVAERLLRQGLPPNISSIHLVAFDGRFQGNKIAFFAQQLIDKVIANKHENIISIGHSRGGLINAYACEYLAEKNNITVDSLFNLGTPFGGSYLALKFLSFFSKSVAEMTVGSTFLKKLSLKIMKSKANYYFIVAANDYIVAKGLSHVPEYVAQKPDSLIELEYHGHLSMVSSHVMVGKIRDILWKAIASQNFKPPRAVDSDENDIEDDLLDLSDKLDAKEFKKADNVSAKEREAFQNIF